MVYTIHSWWFWDGYIVVGFCWVYHITPRWESWLLLSAMNPHLLESILQKHVQSHLLAGYHLSPTDHEPASFPGRTLVVCLYNMGASWNGWMQLTFELASFGFAAGWLCSLPLCASTPQYSESDQTSLSATSTPMPLGAWRSLEVHRWGNTPMDSTQQKMQKWIDWPLGNNDSSSRRKVAGCLLSLPNCRLVCQTGHLSLDPEIFGTDATEINPSCHSSAHPIGNS